MLYITQFFLFFFSQIFCESMDAAVACSRHVWAKPEGINPCVLKNYACTCLLLVRSADVNIKLVKLSRRACRHERQLNDGSVSSEGKNGCHPCKSPCMQSYDHAKSANAGSGYEIISNALDGSIMVEDKLGRLWAARRSSCSLRTWRKATDPW